MSSSDTTTSLDMNAMSSTSTPLINNKNKLDSGGDSGDSGGGLSTLLSSSSTKHALTNSYESLITNKSSISNLNLFNSNGLNTSSNNGDDMLTLTKQSSPNVSTTSTTITTTTTGASSPHLSSASLNEKVAQLASSIYTELEKIVKIYGRDIVKDLMSIVVNILEALDVAYHEKEELLVENELLKDDYEKLLMQYEREKQSRKDTELKLFQSEDSFAEQKRDYEEKVKSLESIVRMIDLKSKNTSDHVLRLEEKEHELKREYNKLHERYTELFKTHCDYLERTKILFGQEGANRLDHSSNSSITNKSNQNQTNLNKSTNRNYNNTSSNNSNLDESLTGNGGNGNSSNGTNQIKSNKLLDLLRSGGSSISRSDLINCLKSLNKSEINAAVSLFLNQELAISSSTSTSSSSGSSSQTNTNNTTTDSTLTIPPGSVTSSLTSLNSSSTNQQTSNSIDQQPTPLIEHSTPPPTHKSINDLSLSSVNHESALNEETNDLDRNKLNLQSSENFDEHLNSNCVEFDDTSSDIHTLNKNSVGNDLDTEFEGDDESLTKNGLSLFNELSRENYDITELDDGADLTGMTREVANLIRENSELLQTKHALNVLKDDLIVRLDQFSSEMLILREEIKSLQTVKAALQLRITELEEESKKSKEELAAKTKKLEEDDESIPMSQRKRFTRAEMARVLMERNQYKERLMDLQEAVRWTEMIRASKQDNTNNNMAQSHSNNQMAMHEDESTNQNSTNAQNSNSNEQQKKRSTVWRFFSDLFGTSSQQQQQQQSSTTGNIQSPGSTMNQMSKPNVSNTNQSQLLSPKISKSSKPTLKSTPSSNEQNQIVPLNDETTVFTTEHQNEKIAKAYEFLKESPTTTNETVLKSAPRLINKKELESIREEGRMQAYGWSLPTSKNNNSQQQQQQQHQQQTTTTSTLLNVSVPVPVYCRPLFKDENNLKLSCASNVNIQFDKSIVPNSIDLDHLFQNSSFNSFKSMSTNIYKSSCIWICNFNENDTHVSIFDANRPGDLVQQFTLKSLRIHSLLSVTGVTKEILSEKEIKQSNQNHHNECTSSLVQINKNEHNDSLDNITYIECEIDQDQNNQDRNSSTSIQSTKSDEKNQNQDQILSTIYPTMWLGSQEGLLLVHSAVSNVSQTLDKVKLKDAILCMTQMNGKVLVGLADGTVAIFQRNLKSFEWDLKNYYLVNFDNSHHSIRCIQNVNNFVWSGCRNKIYILNPDNLTVPTVIEVHPRKENQVRHMSQINDGVWVSIRLDSTLRLYHAKTQQHLQYLDIEPFITRMLGTSNLGLSLVRISSMIIASRRLWIGTGNGVVLSIPFNFNNEDLKQGQQISKTALPGQVVKVTDEIIPFCNLIDSQFSFHGHRDAVKFFLSVPSETIKKNVDSDKSIKTYEKTETMLILSGGHGYIDFRIGDANNASKPIIGSSSPIGDKLNDVKKLSDSTEPPPNTQGLLTNTNKNDRSHLIVWQINENK